MKRILFVDDEPLILDGLRRLLRDRRSEWEMSFAPGGAEALALIEAGPFDVVVSDMRMPGMDGATLLTHVKQDCPAAVRIVLSGHSDLADSLRALAVAHQFLTKPCDAVVLKETITRACALREMLADPGLRQTVSNMDHLPSLPAVYSKLTTALSEPDVTLERIAQVIEGDVAMCAKVLQLVNSAFFMLPRRISSVQAAINALGVSMLRQLVLSVEVFRTLEGSAGPGNPKLEVLQRHALLSGAIARRLMPVRAEADDAFMAGMLHDVGSFLLASLARTQSRDAAPAAGDAPPSNPIAASHASIGGYLMGLWGLPYPIVEAVAYHHQPRLVAPRRFDVLMAVHVATALASELTPDADTIYPPEELDLELLESLGVAGSLPAWREIAAEQAGDLRAAA